MTFDEFCKQHGVTTDERAQLRLWLAFLRIRAELLHAVRDGYVMYPKKGS